VFNKVYSNIIDLLQLLIGTTLISSSFHRKTAMVQHQRCQHPSLSGIRSSHLGSDLDSHPVHQASSPTHFDHFDQPTNELIVQEHSEDVSFQHESRGNVSPVVYSNLIPDCINTMFQTTGSMPYQPSFVTEQEDPRVATMVVHPILQVPWQQLDRLEGSLLIGSELNASPPNPTTQSVPLHEGYHDQQVP
jgi:hypothetical protein